MTLFFANDWEQRKLGEMSNSFEYGLNAAATEFDGVHKYIRITDIDDTSHEFLQNGLTTPDADLSIVDNYKLQEGDILFARTGASVGKTYIYKETDGLVYYAGFLIRARINNDYDARFIFQNTLTNSYNNFINITSQRSGQPGVNAQEYGRFTISVPTKDEQTKIGVFFDILDKFITLHQRKLEQLEQLKNTLLSKMFPKSGTNIPEIRFSGFTDAWKQRKLNDIIDREIKGRAKAENICIHNSEKKSIYLDTDFLNGGKTRYVNVSEDTSEKDIIILWDGSQAGKVYKGTPGALGSTLKAYTIQNYTLFYYYQLISNQEKIYQQYRTPNIPHVIKSFTREFIVTDTHDDEKQLIIKLYNNLFSSIAIHQRKLEQLKNLKQTLLNKMFI